jgi:hypothetical protein
MVGGLVVRVLDVTVFVVIEIDIIRLIGRWLMIKGLMTRRLTTRILVS